MNKTLRFTSLILCLVMLFSMFTVYAGALSVTEIPNPTTTKLDYDKLFETAYVVNGAWTAGDLTEGSELTFRFKGEDIKEEYDASRHFADFDSAYNRYLATDPDIMTDVPVFIFAPGTYSKKITLRYSAIILGANAGINPNDTTESWTANAMSDGWAANTARDSENETVFSGGITRTTRATDSGGNDVADWAYALEMAERAAGQKSTIKLIIDGVKITGAVGVSHYDYSNHSYTMKLNGVNTSFSPTGRRNTLTAIINTVVDNFTGSAGNTLFASRCDSFNKNVAVLKDTRITNANGTTNESNTASLFHRHFNQATIDGVYLAHSNTSLFGSLTTDSAFCGKNESRVTARYNQDVTIKNSVFYKNTAMNPISIGNAYTKGNTDKENGVAMQNVFKSLKATVTNNIFYDAVYRETNRNYWGIFGIFSMNTAATYEANITHNIIHQTSTPIETLFNGNTGYQKAKTTINFNYNKVTGQIVSIYPNMGHSEEVTTNKLFYNFGHNFYAPTPSDEGTLSDWTVPPLFPLASGYDYTSAEYYLDYDMTTLASELRITDISGLGDKVTITDSAISAQCHDFSGVLTPIFETASSGVSVEMYSDSGMLEPIINFDIDEIESSRKFYIKIYKGDVYKTLTLYVYSKETEEIYDISQLDPAKFNFPIINVNTDGGAPIVNKKDYVPCGVSITNTDADNCLETSVAGIRYRGNSTYTSASKKAYRIKFDKKQDLFGIGKAKSWVLLANAFDKTMVRNTIAFALGIEIGLEYTSEYQYVNLYINGQYKGLYLLCEQTEVAKNRVNVEELKAEDGDDPSKIDTGYLVELTGNGDRKEDAYFTVNEIDSSLFGVGVSKNWRVNTIYGYVKSPEKKSAEDIAAGEYTVSDEQVEFIAEWVNNVNYAILTQNMEMFKKYADVDSFAKFFIVNTLMNNGDGGFQIYLYKKENGGKIYAGPLWDFDQSSAASTHCGDTYSVWYQGSSNPWFDSFYNWTEFMKIAKKYYYENLAGFKEIIDYYTDDFYNLNAYDFNANDALWKALGSDYNRITSTIKKLTTFEDNFSHLGKWFDNRITWMSAQYDRIKTPATGITISQSMIALEKGELGSVTATPIPFYATTENIEWESSDTSVAEVDNAGNIYAADNGEATITVRLKGTDQSVTCLVTVYTTEYIEGTITINDTYKLGDVISPKYKINSPNCSHVIEWYRDGKKIGAANSETYTVTRYDLDCELQVKFVATGFSVGTVESNIAKILKEYVEKPSAPTVANNTTVTAEKLILTRNTDYEYRMDDGEWQESNIFYNLTPGKTYVFTQRYAETQTEYASESSEPLTITIPKNAAGAPLAPAMASSTDTSITLVAHAGYEYRINGGAWQSLAVFEGLTLGNTYTFTQRIAETETTMASAESSALIIKLLSSNVATPAAPTVQSKTATKVTLTPVSGCEYRVNGGAWQSTNVFDGLKAGAEYTFEQRMMQTETHFASKASLPLKVTLSKADAKAPTEPKVESVSDKTVTLVAVPGYEYKIEGGAWQKSNVFSGLTPNTKYVFIQRIAETETTKASADSKAVTARTVSGIDSGKFSDIKVGSWYEAYCDTVIQYGIFNGVSDTKFEPNTPITRAMFVQALAKLAGVTTDKNAKTKFTDVPSGKWFTGAVKWASDCGVVNGITATTFEPNTNITREQMCAMMVRFADYYGIKLEAKVAKAAFSDDSKIRNYAKEAVYACQMAGIVNGMPDGTFDPRGTATRAQVAKILAVFFTDYMY